MDTVNAQPDFADAFHNVETSKLRRRVERNANGVPDERAIQRIAVNLFGGYNLQQTRPIRV